ncbi:MULTISPECIES: hypothetical protein [Nostocales]|jgi:hypothetical protein|uniref:Uncharacterized protein n=1 Tax=Dolichospermum flos-aquae UHCC 0037 TaxID=2590026 RepID=A0ACC7S5T2_DOLFA|nr:MULTISPECIES: hypothetical protein [Nostocales]ALB43061.1 hypothetical protein AA650_23715 [Anabaena sp. WA102]MBO1065538.1 hypothetical protein [Anabaena sp. 54]MTJ43865.1 hypothetical protein [Dolichospermum flos-aquae UHCC 0037]OBQ22823.1 MAG: hypothetical protein AN486_01380 [Anabaena sp. AL93]
MKALEVTGKIQQGQLTLDYPLEVDGFNIVKVIILLPEADDIESDPDDTPIQEIKESLKTALQEAKAGKRIPLEKMWEGIDAE